MWEIERIKKDNILSIYLCRSQHGHAYLGKNRKTLIVVKNGMSTRRFSLNIRVNQCKYENILEELDGGNIMFISQCYKQV